ncbi:hypothetical protein HXY32_08100 [Candidatus Bathyarchaeota archaeon]|nr:hypothetical protein [Candidatus Bathyarchaeota archaeon]
MNALDLVEILINILISTIIVSPILWLSGRGLVGKEKAKFTDAIWIVLLGNIIGVVIGVFLYGWLAAIVMFIVWLALIKHFFDCGWLMAFAIALVAVIIFIIVSIILALIGIAVIAYTL